MSQADSRFETGQLVKQCSTKGAHTVACMTAPLTVMQWPPEIGYLNLHQYDEITAWYCMREVCTFQQAAFPVSFQTLATAPQHFSTVALHHALSVLSHFTFWCRTLLHGVAIFPAAKRAFAEFHPDYTNTQPAPVAMLCRVCARHSVMRKRATATACVEVFTCSPPE